jgi:hypothetical protein
MPVVPRVTDKLMVITEHGERDQIAVLEERDLVQHYVTRIGARSMVGNVYLGAFRTCSRAWRPRSSMSAAAATRSCTPAR